MKLSNINSVPEGWSISYLSEVGKFISGVGFPEKYQNKKGLSYPFFKVGHLGTISSNEKLTLSEHTVDETIRKTLKAAIIPIDSVVFAKIGMAIRLNRRRLIGVPSCIDNNVMAIIPLNIILPKYLLRYLETIDFMPLTQATTVPSLPKTALENLEIPLPPLNEQRRIVAKLEVLLGKVDECQKRLEKIPRILKRFRQSVLAAACDRRLTADWREKNNFNIQDWLSTSLSKVANLRLGKMLDKVKNIGEPTLYLRNINVRWFSFELDNLALIKCTDKDRKDLSICDGDVLICEGGEPGRCAVWSHGKMNLIFQKAIHRVRLVDNVLPYWLMINIKTDADSGHLESYFTGTTIKHLTGQSLAKYSFDVPPLAEQQEIVRRVESLFKLADQLEARYQKAKSYVDKLTQSILAKAFRGELVAQDPNDEPASVLLERIKQEKEAATTEKSRKVNVKSKVANKKESKELKELKEIVVENSISNKEKFIEVMEEKISSSLDKIAVDVEKLGEQMTLPFMENEK